MVVVEWRLRGINEAIDLTGVYDGAPTMFTIKLHHGGRFTKLPSSYVDGQVRYIDLVDIDTFSIHELDAMMLELDYSVPPIIYYHFRIPDEDLDFGLRALGNDEDVLNLAKYVGENKVIEVYTEHGKTNRLTYFMSPKGKPRVIIQEVTDNTAKIDKISDIVDKERCKKAVTQENNDLDVEGQLGEYMSLILFDSAKQVSRGESSCSKQLILDDLDAENAKRVEDEYDFEGEDELEDEDDVEHEDQDDGDATGNIFVDDYNGFENMDMLNEFDPFVGDHYQPPNKETDKIIGEEGEPVVQECEEDNDDLVDEENNVLEVEVDMTDFSLNIGKDSEDHETDGILSGLGDADEEEDVVVIDNDRWDSLDEGSEQERKRRCVLKNLVKEKKCSLGKVHKVSFCVGQKFKTKQALKEKIDMHALQSKRNLYFKKNDKTRLRALCRGQVPVIDASGVVGSSAGGSNKDKSKGIKAGKVKCTWALHASRTDPESDWFIRTLNLNHTCQHSRKIRACTATFLSKQIMDQIESNPDIPLKALQEQLEKKFEVGVSVDKVFRAKDMAAKNVVGDYTKQYELLRDYVLELQATNLDTTVKIDVHSSPNPSSPTRKFKRIYICLGPLKKGFKAGLRDLLGFDGAFMKGPFPGQVLSAVSLDSNNGIYPLAYGVVETENIHSWKWFLACLADDLELSSNSNFTFITDRQKGLIPAIEQLFPNAEHRYCLRHIYQNMRVKWRLKEYKEHVWKCASATTIPEFEHYMNEFSQYDKEACDWLKNIPPKHWARSHFSGRAISDMLLNNVCEVFNSKIIHGRDKPIIGCLEYIRQYLMKRICNVMKEMNKAVGPLTPTATVILDANKSSASQYIARWNGGHKYQVSGAWQEQHVVDVKNNTCSCIKWELIGIPCKHAIATLYEMTRNSEDVGDIYKWVHKVYWLDTWKEAYSFKVEPIKGRIMWPKSSCPTKLTPPPHQKKPGRPKKKRRQTEDEKLSQSQRGGKSQQGSQCEMVSQNVSQVEGSSVGPNGVEKMTRKYGGVTCSKCKGKGHNARTCKGLGGQ